MLQFTLTELRNFDDYRTAVMNGFKIHTDINEKYLRFFVVRNGKKTSLSGKITTFGEFRSQLIVFIQELS